MQQPERIAPKAQSTPMSFGGAHNTARAIPEDLLKEASRRLEVMALLAAVLWALAIYSERQHRGGRRNRIIRAVLLRETHTKGAAVHSEPWSRLHGSDGCGSRDNHALVG